MWIQVSDALDPELVSVRVNDQWTWAYLDLKANLIRVDAGSSVGELVMDVQDEVGNRTTFTHTL